MQFYRGLTPIKAITFDLDDTLYDNHSVMVQLEGQFIEWLNQNAQGTIPWKKHDWRALRLATLQQDPNLRHDMTQWRVETLQAGLEARGFAKPQRYDIVAQAMQLVYQLRNRVDIEDTTHHILSKLKQRFPLAALTNGNVDVAAIGLDGYFEFTLQAGRDGASKPCCDLFDSAAARLGLKPCQILHVGDHLRSDVVGAQRAGFQSAWLNLSGKPLYCHPRARTLPTLEITNLGDLLRL